MVTGRVPSFTSALRDAVLTTVIEWCVRHLSTEAQAGLYRSVAAGRAPTSAGFGKTPEKLADQSGRSPSCCGIADHCYFDGSMRECHPEQVAADAGRSPSMTWGPCATCGWPEVTCRSRIESATNAACCRDCKHLGTAAPARTSSSDTASS